ncbi:hypothetical protein AHF37_09883 [Paragonimus kellicotti]|nr:hypothetical protein AHF37_09883 [Paragonimus kellicotti]
MVVGDGEARGYSSELNFRKTAGSDEVYLVILGPLTDVLAGSLASLFNKSSGEAKLHADWKVAAVAAIPKVGSRDETTINGPVSLMAATL